ncbi:hypothetical protein [Methanosarcina mazei]|jgi:hypothetical protein|nr:hypothetical protein [Methanosarcina mazei]
MISFSGKYHSGISLKKCLKQILPGIDPEIDLLLDETDLPFR